MPMLRYFTRRQDAVLLQKPVWPRHFIEGLKGFKRMVASLIIWLIGGLLVGVGSWILLLRFEGLIDLIWPHNMMVGQMIVDGKESKSHAELLRARFDHHFRRADVIPIETGFLEVQSLDAPRLFQQKRISEPLKKMTVEVSGVDVTVLARLIKQVAKPDHWIIEGDFQTTPDCVLLALRMRRGQRLIRTWYLERSGNTDKDKSMLLERLIDDAIFQLAYDFGNPEEEDEDLLKWRKVLPSPAIFPSREALAAYYEGRGALARYYANGDWQELETGLEKLRSLRGQMPKYVDGLQLLAMALAEKRHESEATHVYEQLLLLLRPADGAWENLRELEIYRLFSVELRKATALTKLYTWPSTHQAYAELSALEQKLKSYIDKHYPEINPDNVSENCVAFHELYAQTSVQLAYCYGIYLSFIRHVMVATVFGSPEAPDTLRIKNERDLQVLKGGKSKEAEEAKAIVRRVIRQAATEHDRWIEKAKIEQEKLKSIWQRFEDGQRREADLAARLNFAMGYTHYRMAELESGEPGATALVEGQGYRSRLDNAAKVLRDAEAAHPNHYQVLQFLGLVYSEPRRKDGDLNIAEHYFDRAISAKRSDYYGHALLADLLLRRISETGLELSSRELLERGLKEVNDALSYKEVSGTVRLLRAKLLLLQLEIERDETRRQGLWKELDLAVNQAERFVPEEFNQPNVDLRWVQIVAAARRLGEEAKAAESSQDQATDAERQQRLESSRDSVMNDLDKLLKSCETLQNRWVAHQRIFQVNRLEERASRLQKDLTEQTTLAKWREIPIQILY
ncbi:MAG: hypothetical protein ACYSWQ_12935 [Planctomycetota bacterium]